MKYSYDLLEADSLERLVFLMNADGQRGYKLVGEVRNIMNVSEDREYYEALMEREIEFTVTEIERRKREPNKRVHDGLLWPEWEEQHNIKGQNNGK